MTTTNPNNENLRKAIVESLAPSALSDMSDADIEQLLNDATVGPMSDATVARILKQANPAHLTDRTVRLPRSKSSEAQPGSSREITMSMSNPQRPGSGRGMHRGSITAMLVSSLALLFVVVLTARPKRPEEIATAPPISFTETVKNVWEEQPLVREISAAVNKYAPVKIGQPLETKSHEQRRLSLPDGSVLFMNENTTAKLDSLRQLSVTKGEVFVEVCPQFDENSQREAFFVKTPRKKVKAIGTRFAVKADGNNTDVLVTQGKVLVDGLDETITSGRFVRFDANNDVQLSVAPRASEALTWTEDLMAAAPIVPRSRFCGGALVSVDPNGQEMNLSMRKYHVDVHIEDGFARTTIDQTYFNHTWSRLKGMFKFPLPADASLSRLAMYVGPKLMEGGMAERKHARNTFEQIVHTKRDPALLEWIDGSTFQMEVFPLEPRQEKRLLISYTQRLKTAYGKTHYRFPAGHSMDVVRDWSTRVLVKNGAALAFKSPSHPLHAERSGGDLVLSTSLKNALFDRDFVLEIEDEWNNRASQTVLAAVDAPSVTESQPGVVVSASAEAKKAESAVSAGKSIAAVVTNDRAVLATRPVAETQPLTYRLTKTTQEGRQYLMLRDRPVLSVKAEKKARNWVFLYETSGDRNPVLARTQIEVVRTLLENAEHEDTFNIVAAGTRTNQFRDTAVACESKNIDDAVTWMEKSHIVGALDLQKALRAGVQLCNPIVLASADRPGKSARKSRGLNPILSVPPLKQKKSATVFAGEPVKSAAVRMEKTNAESVNTEVPVPASAERRVAIDAVEQKANTADDGVALGSRLVGTESRESVSDRFDTSGLVDGVRGSERETFLVHVGSGLPVLGETSEQALVADIPKSIHYVGVGVGKKWSRQLMRMAASRTGGYFTQINPDEKVQWRAFELHSVLNAPRLTNVSVVDDAEKLSFLTYAESIAHGDEICAITRLAKDAELPKKLVVSGHLNGELWRQSVDVTDVSDEADYLPRSWARLEIDRLIADGANKHRAEIVDLSKAMYVMSPFTSLLVLETDADYTRFGVDRGRKDHWALYPAPDTIKVVKEPTQRGRLAAVRKERDSGLGTVLRRPEDRLFARSGDVQLATAYGKLMNQRQYAEAEIVAKQIYDIVPKSSEAMIMVEKARFARRELSLRRAFPSQTDAAWGALDDVEGLSPMRSAISLKETDGWDRLFESKLTADWIPNSALYGRPSISLMDESEKRERAGFLSGTIEERRADRQRAIERFRTETFVDREYFNLQGDVILQPLEELGAIIVKGNESDLTTTKRILEQLEELDRTQSFGARQLSIPSRGGQQLGRGTTVRRRQAGARVARKNQPAKQPGQKSDGQVMLRRLMRLEDLQRQQNQPVAKFIQPQLTPEAASRELFFLNSWDIPSFTPSTSFSISGEPAQFGFDPSGGGGFGGGGLPGIRYSLPTTMFNGPSVTANEYGAWFDLNQPADHDANGRTRSQLQRGYFESIPHIDSYGWTFREFPGHRRKSGQSAKALVPRFERDYRTAVSRFGLNHPKTVEAARQRDSVVRIPKGRFLNDLMAHAPGLNSMYADAMAVLEAESNDKPTRGKVDEQARKLIVEARGLGWETVTLTWGGDTVAVHCNGQGQFAWQRSVSEGLLEQVLCDGENAWHLYDEIGLGAKRTYSRFHRSMISSIAPWLVAPAEELAINADVVLLDEYTIGVVPLNQGDTAHGLVRVEMQFAKNGGLRERRVVGIRGDVRETLAKTVFAREGAVTVFGSDGKQLTRIQRSRRAGRAYGGLVGRSVAATLKSRRNQLVILPLPYRSASHVFAQVGPNAEQHHGHDRNYANWSEENALALIASDVISGNAPRITDVVMSRFFRRDDTRAGLYVLIANANARRADNQKPIINYQPNDKVPAAHRALVRFVRHLALKPTEQQFAEDTLTTDGLRPAAREPGFLHRIASARNTYYRWINGAAIQQESRSTTQDEVDKAIRVVGSLKSPEIAWTILRAMQPHLEKPRFQAQFAEAAKKYEHAPHIGWFVRHERIRALFAANKAEEAAALYGKLLTTTLKAGFNPGIDAELRKQFIEYRGRRNWSDMCRRTAMELIADGLLRTAVTLSKQLRDLGDIDTASTIVDKVLAKLEPKDRPDVGLLLVQHYRQQKDDAAADAMLRRTLQNPRLAISAKLWRFGSELAEARGRNTEALARLERAINIEFITRPDVINLQETRAKYANLLTRYEKIIDASATLEQEPPADLATRVIRAADQWRALEDKDTQVCQLTSRVLKKLKRDELAWDYLTTPLATQPGSDSWRSLGQNLSQQDAIEDASNAFTRAFEFEESNPEILYEHAVMLRNHGRSEAARALLTRITTRKWQPRFNGVKANAANLLRQDAPDPAK